MPAMPTTSTTEPNRRDDTYTEAVKKMESSIAMFYSVHDDPDDDSYVGPTPDHMDHLASWLVGEGWVKKTS